MRRGSPLEMQEYIVKPCSSAVATGSCSGWRLRDEVDLVAGVYEVNTKVAEGLTFDDSAPLWSCDDAKIVSKPGGFEIADADAGELLYEVGLRNFDKVQTINGQDVTTWAAPKRLRLVHLRHQHFQRDASSSGSTVTLTWTLVD